MKKFCVAAAFLLYVLITNTPNTFAETNFMDSPHNNYTEGVECGSCHLVRNGTVPFWYLDPPVDIDDTNNNRSCWVCHNGIIAPFKETHSSVTLGEKYGAWSIECVDCHWGFTDTHGSHGQKGVTAARLVEGTIESVSAYNSGARTTDLVLVASGGEANWNAGRWDGYIVYVTVPTWTGSIKSYEIRTSDASVSNGGTSRVTLSGNATDTPIGTAFHIVRGKFVNKTINGRSVRFYDKTGANSFVTTPAGAGVCEACHTQTTYFRAGQGHAYNVSAGDNCTRCHETVQGFKVRGACNTCHGQGQEAGAPYTADELVNYGGTTGQGVGSHATHVPAVGGDNETTCEICHSANGMPVPDKLITISFSGIAGTTGVFDGAVSLANGYAYVGSVTNGGTLTCSNVECHDNGTGSPSTTPAWGTSAGACAACHEAAPTTGSHTAHLNATIADVSCEKCHKGAVQGSVFPVEHLDTNVDVYFDVPGDLSYPADKAKGSPYLSCSAFFCHNPSDLGNASPIWGSGGIPDVAECDSCHGGDANATAAAGLGPMSTGSHGAHIDQTGPMPVQLPCARCHSATMGISDNRTVAEAREPDHMNRIEDVVFDLINPDGAYSATLLSCSDVYCHSSVQPDGGTGTPGYTNPVWGATGTVECGGCHNADGANGDLSLMATGSHTRHADYMAYACSVCHSTDSHVDGVIDVNILIGGGYDGNGAGDHSAGLGYGACSGVYCHGNFAGSGLNATPTWGNTASGACGTCHGASAAVWPAGGSHRAHVGSSKFACGVCHSDTTSGNNVSDITYHANGSTDWHLNPSDARVSGGTYAGSATGTNTPPANLPYQQCTDLYCHSNIQGSPDPTLDPVTFTTPVWGIASSGDCGTCHGLGAHPNGPIIGIGNMGTGSHAKHLDYHFGSTVRGNPTCQMCHYVPAGACQPCHPGAHNTTVFERTDGLHADGSIDINFKISYTGSGSYSGDSIPGTAYGQCDNLYCHSLGDTSVQSAQLDPLYGGSIYTSPSWGQTTAIGCNGCHGRTTLPGEPDYGGPDYVNTGQGLENSNSHPAHLATGLNCSECHFMTTRDGVSINTVDENGDTYEDGFVAHVDTVNTDVYFDPTRNPAATYSSDTKTCSNVTCHSSPVVWGGPPLECLDCHDTAIQGRRNVDTDFTLTSHHVAAGPPSRSQCLICHDHSQHTQGSVRLVNADTGFVYTYTSGSDAEEFCLSCHDTDGMAGNLSPFGDGRTLGVDPHRAGTGVAAAWAKGAVQGHRAQGLTCLGDGAPGTGCHATGHGSGNVGLLAKNMTLPITSGLYDPLDFDLCFDCHANETAPLARTKEEIFGVRFGGVYDNDYGPQQAPAGSGNYNPPYDIPDVLTSYRDKNYQATGKAWDDYEAGSHIAKNLHWYHISMADYWNYRGFDTPAYWSGFSCQACHDVHGTDSPYGMLHEEIGYSQTVSGSDTYSQIGNPNGLYAFPMGCAVNCHDTLYYAPSSAWVAPAYDNKIIVADATVAEDGGSIIFTVTADPHSESLTLTYYTKDHLASNHATGDVDYQAVPQASPGTLQFGVTETVKTLSIPVYTDALAEGDETFYLILSYVSGDVTIGRNPATGTIQDVAP